MAENKLSPEQEALVKEMEGMKADLEKSISEKTDAAIVAKLKEQKDAIDEAIKLANEKSATAEEVAAIKADLTATIRALDILQTRVKGTPAPKQKSAVSLSEAVGKVVEGLSKDDIDNLTRNKSASLIVPLGNVDLSIDWKADMDEEKMRQKTDMILSNTITGTTVLTYNQRQALVPSQKVNIRDLVPTVPSPTGQYVTYAEDSGLTNNIAAQTEGSSKGNNVYTLTATTLNNPYIAGFSRFSKQLLKFTPFMQGTLSRMLMRDYFKKENAAGMTVLATGTGPTSMGSSPDDVKQLIALIAGFAATDYNPSYILTTWAIWGRLLTSTYTSGYYPGAGAVSIVNNQLSIGGVPIVPTSWVTSSKACLVDSDYLERIEVEGLNLAFSYEDADNFTKNLITARVECQTAFNLMTTKGICYADLGVS
jgi:hypothetical protein